MLSPTSSKIALFGVAGLICLATFSAPVTALATPAPKAATSAPPNIKGELTGIAAVSATDIWAVGYTSAKTPATVILHWNGKSWARLGGQASLAGATLSAVAASSPTSAWAVGSTSSSKPTTVVLHWDGHSWTRQGGSAAVAGFLSAVATAPGDKAWAVGGTNEALSGKALVLGWNGAGWAQQPTPGGPGLFGVAATSADDVWAVGFRVAYNKPLIAHWNGSSWTSSPAPAVTTGFYHITATSASQAWATGYWGGGGTPGPVIAHRNGSVWKTYKVPSTVEYNAGNLGGISALSDGQAWAVGVLGLGYSNAFILRWNGSAWTEVKLGFPASTESSLSAVAALSQQDAWAVGAVGSSILVMHWDGKNWTRA